MPAVNQSTVLDQRSRSRPRAGPAQSGRRPTKLDAASTGHHTAAAPTTGLADRDGVPGGRPARRLRRRAHRGGAGADANHPGQQRLLSSADVAVGNGVVAIGIDQAMNVVQQLRAG